MFNRKALKRVWRKLPTAAHFVCAIVASVTFASTATLWSSYLIVLVGVVTFVLSIVLERMVFKYVFFSKDTVHYKVKLLYVGLVSSAIGLVYSMVMLHLFEYRFTELDSAVLLYVVCIAVYVACCSILIVSLRIWRCMLQHYLI